MKRPMDCDLVFEILTRGPFPSGDATDGAVERHLAACHECRQLAEALRPAVDLFHESVPVEDLMDLPGYHGTLREPARRSSPSGAATAIASAVTPRVKRSWQWRPWTEFAAGRLAIALLVGAIAGGLWWGLVDSKQPRSRSRPPRTLAAAGVSPATWPSDDGWKLLRSLSLPRACEPSFASETPAFLSNDGPRELAADSLTCCTRCHAMANPERPALTSVASLLRSCRACHDGIENGGP